MSTTSDKTSDVRSKLEKEINNLLQPSNLQNDAELNGAIDANANLPVSKIVNKLNSITSDVDLITDILSKCELCVLSGDKSTITVKRSTERTTILLRDIDEKATEEDIKGLFTDPNLGPIKRIEKELANTWLVTFDSESHAKSAALQAMKKEINGNRVHARLVMTKIIGNNSTTTTTTNGTTTTTTTTTTTIGSESVTTVNISPSQTSSLSSSSATTATATTPTGSSATALPYDPNSTDSYSYYTQFSQYYYPNSGYDYNNEDLPPNTPALGIYEQNIYSNNMRMYGNNNNNRRGYNNNNNRNRNYNNNNNNNRKDDNNGRRNNGRNGRKFSRGGGGNRYNYNNNNNRRNDDYYNSNNNNNNNSYLSSIPPQPILQELSFPPLASDENTNTYKEPYISYTEDEIIKIVKNYTKFSLPPNLQPGNHSAAIGDKPNARLLEFQRSMSIDQALEHSRPFRFDSVDSTDYSNMIYGEIDVESLSKKPLPSSQTGIIPPPFEPKGYATVVKTGKSNNNNNNNNTVVQQQPPPPTSTSTSTNTAQTNNNNNNSNKSRNRTGSKDKKRKKSGHNNSSNNNNANTTTSGTATAGSAATTVWSYFPAESSSPSSNTNNNQSSNHHKSNNRKGNNNNKGKSNNNNTNTATTTTTATATTTDNASTEPKQNSWASVVTKSSPSPPKSDSGNSSSNSSASSSNKADSKVKSDS